MGGEVTDLIEELKKETEQSRRAAEEVSPYTQPAEDKEDQNRPPSNEDISDDNAHFEDLDEQPKEEPPAYNPEKANSTAKRWIKMFGAFLKICMRPIYRRTIFAKGDREAMQEFQKRNRGINEKELEDALHNDVNMQPITARFDKYMEALKDLPLDPDEIASIAEPLSEVIAKHRKLQLSPEMSLLMAVAFVMLPRLAPMMPDLSKIFTAAEQKTK